MKQIKHIGKLANTGAKVAVVFRTLPGDSHKSLIIPVSQLNDSYHDALMSLIESDQGQEANELGEIMHVRMFPDGRPMLEAMQVDGRLQVMATDNVTMTPTTTMSILLSDLNALIAEQKGVAIDELAHMISGAPPARKQESTVQESVYDEDTPVESSTSSVLSDTDLAKSYRSQADAMYKEAARLRRQADELDPPKKKVSIKETESA
jgi:hypothetical protein